MIIEETNEPVPPIRVNPYTDLYERIGKMGYNKTIKVTFEDRKKTMSAYSTIYGYAKRRGWNKTRNVQKRGFSVFITLKG